ncbi:flavodoxin domain-containing protein [Timonella sp. A28]|uniref:flavodoxin domain-containing protein n=1 Tax=Timonella sp. A28 TaxID=3442640 RepID=UPI003EBD7217
MRVLVTAASRHGSTREIAAVIEQELQTMNFECDLKEPRDVESVEGYDAVIVGSAIYVGQWLGEARDLIERVGPAMKERKVWLFSSGLADTPSKDANNTPALLARMKATGALGHRHFPGKLDVLQLSLAERAAIMAARGKYGDSRDMAAVRDWARSIGESILDQRTISA